MPKRSVIEQLPPEVLSAIELFLVENSFSRFQELSQILETHGYRVSTSQIGRYSQRMQKITEEARSRLEGAKLLVAAVGDERQSMTEATLLMAQSHLLGLLERAETEDLAPKDLSNIARAAKDLGLAARDHKKWLAALREEDKRKLDGLAREGREKGGIDLATLDRVREVYGLA